MSRNDVSNVKAAPRDNPWPYLGGGLAAVALSVILPNSPPGVLIPLRTLLLLGGLVTVGVAVRNRLTALNWSDLDERLNTSGILAVAALAPLLAYFGFGTKGLGDGWDCARLTLAVLTSVALGGAILVTLPEVGRKVVISLLVIFHFGGIMVAVSSVPPAGSQAPWLTRVLWMHVYRPYLQFMYLNNAYHFYSPDPGPPTLLWFYVKFDDGSHKWIKVPDREDFPTRQQFQRRIALAESINAIQGFAVPSDDLLHRRIMAGNQHDPPIPVDPTFLPINQWKPPMPYAARLVSSYARHVARTAKSGTNPDAKVKSIMVYRVVHKLLNPDQIGKIDPYDPALYLPWYQGEYNPAGELLDPESPYLYWAIPIYYTQGGNPRGLPLMQNPGNWSPDDLVDFTDIHTGGKK